MIKVAPSQIQISILCLYSILQFDTLSENALLYLINRMHMYCNSNIV